MSAAISAQHRVWNQRAISSSPHIKARRRVSLPRGARTEGAGPADGHCRRWSWCQKSHLTLHLGQYVHVPWRALQLWASAGRGDRTAPQQPEQRGP